jgi:hypothetical protein
MPSDGFPVSVENSGRIIADGNAENINLGNERARVPLVKTQAKIQVSKSNFPLTK